MKLNRNFKNSMENKNFFKRISNMEDFLGIL